MVQKIKIKKPELLAPVQDWVSLQAAIEAGADAVYFGVHGFNMRAGAKNFEIKDLKKIVKRCRSRSLVNSPSRLFGRQVGKGQHIRTYLAVNTIVYESELKNIERILKAAKVAGINAIICWDMAVFSMAKKLRHEVHLSTQASISNSLAAEFYKKAGVTRIILARECNLDDIRKIKKNFSNPLPPTTQSLTSDVSVGYSPLKRGRQLEVETFIHGAMCVSESGRCFLSEHLYGKSANRGQCLQPCRRKYLIKQVDGEEELELGEDYVLSPKDLCTVPFIEKLIEAGIDCFKIEGRNRSPEYVKTVTGVYRKAIDFYFSHHPVFASQSHPFGLPLATLNSSRKGQFEKEFDELKKELLQDLKTVYNRGLSSGFFLGKPLNQWTHSYGSQAVEKKVHLGRIKKYYPKIKVAEVLIEAGRIVKFNDEVYIQGEQTGVVRQKIKSMEIEHQLIKKAGQGDLVAIKVGQKVRRGDVLYKISRNKKQEIL